MNEIKIAFAPIVFAFLSACGPLSQDGYNSQKGWPASVSFSGAPTAIAIDAPAYRLNAVDQDGNSIPASWSSSDIAVATVDQNGLVTPISLGWTKIRATGAGGAQAALDLEIGAAVSTLAGRSGQSGRVDGIGDEARFNGPRGIAVDGVGNLFVCDYFNNTIRKISPGGTVSTWVGAPGISGSADGIGGAARFDFPIAICIDASGTLFLADYGNYTIRSITSAGAVSTLAGAAHCWGTVDGVGSAARFYSPRSICVDASGNVYVSDSYADTIRKIAAGGTTVGTLAGSPLCSGSVDARGIDARFNIPQGIAADSSGAIYVSDFSNCTIRRISPSGDVGTLAGYSGQEGSSDGFGSDARFYGPVCIAVAADGTIYVSDHNNSTIRMITPAGHVSTLAGTAGLNGETDGVGHNARFGSIFGIAVDAAGCLYVADSMNNTIRKVKTRRTP